MSALTPLALTFADILRHLRTSDIGHTHAEVAKATGRDTSNTRRDLGKLADAGLVLNMGGRETPCYILARAGDEALQALDRANGKDGAVAGLPVWPLAQIAYNPDNPRKAVSDDFIDGLADTIVEAGGLLQPIILYPADASGVRMLHAGEQRVRACRRLVDEDRLPPSLAQGLPFTEREASKAEALFVGLVENGQRTDLSPWEDAQALKAYADETGLSARAIAFKIGRAREGSEKGVADVQQKIKTARKATPANIALHESGVWTWERLRESAQEAKDAPAPATSAELEPEQVELVEAVAAATPSEELDPDLIVAVLEIAHRANLYPGPPSALGPSSKVTDFIDPSKGSAKYPLATALAAGGYALFVHNYPQHVVLLRPGVDLVKRFADTPDQLDAAIRTALREAGIEEGDIDDLEREAKYQTEWLNVPPPPKPTEISDADALVLLELYDSQKREAGPGYVYNTPAYYGARVQPSADRAVLEDLQERKLVRLRLDEPQKDGSLRVEPTTYNRPNCEEALKGRWPEIGKAGERTKALFSIRAAVLGQAEAEAAKKEKRYSTPWLNGPFEISAEIQAKIDEEARRKAQSERDQTAQAAREKAAAEALELAVSTLEAEARTMDPEKVAKRIVELLGQLKSPAPWSRNRNSYYGFATDARGSSVQGSREGRLAVIALNALTGIWPEAEEEQVTVIVFERWLAEAFQEEHGLTVASVAAECANKALKRELEGQDVAFGSDGFEWDRDYANEIAALWAEDFIRDGVIVEAEPDQSHSNEEQADAVGA